MRNVYINYLEDKNGNQQVADMIDFIIEKSKSNINYDQLRQRVTHGLFYIGKSGIVEDELQEVTGHTDDGLIYTLAPLIKPLKNHPPFI